MSDLATIDPEGALSESAARELTDTIKQTITIAWRQIVRAYEGRAWVALGYSSWDEYCDAEFDGARLRLPREERTDVVRSLSDAGLSVRAIAAAAGIGVGTVVRDLGVPNGTPDLDPDSEITEAEIVHVGEITHKPTTVTGLDGKTYPKSKPGPASKVEDVRTLAALGLDADAIAEDLGISRTRVMVIAREASIPIVGSQLEREQRWERVAELAAQGYSSRQITERLGLTDDNYVRELARKRGIEFPADAVVLNTRRLDSTRIVSATVGAVDGIGIMFHAITYADLDAEDVKGWLPVLDESIRSLTTLRNELRKVSQP